jgi:hypothetical protein
VLSSTVIQLSSTLNHSDFAVSGDPAPRERRTVGMRTLALALCVAAIAAPAAVAKGKVTISIGDPTPRVGRPFAVDVRTSWRVPPNDWLRLIAVARGKDWYQVVGTVTGDSSRTHANLPHDGFEVRMRRAGAYSWRAVVRLPRPGRWRIVLPNGTHVGFMVPVPSAWMPFVQVRR